jgi:trk system potassium uptake protein TrkA
MISADDIVYFITTKEHMDEIREMCGKVKRNIKSVIIVGASRIGIRFALQFHERYDIKIIDANREKCEEVAAMLPDCEVVCGDARNVEVLRENNIFRYDAFMALTDSSETNILACLTAKEFNVPKTIAEVENIQFISQAEKLNIGNIINKKLLASSRIFQLLLDADADNSKCLALADAEVAEIQVKKGANITKKLVRDLHLPYGMTLGAYTRDGRCCLIDGNTKIEVGDYVVVFCLSGFIHKIEKWFN